MTEVNLLFPHQLFHQHELYHNRKKIILIEEQLFFHEFIFHKRKLAFHRASMKAHADYLTKKGIQLEYIDSQIPESDVRKLIPQLAEQGVRQINYIDPSDNWLHRRITQSSSEFNIKLNKYESPLFINDTQSLKQFFKPEKKSFFQTSFYKSERSRLGLLLEDDGSPVGGQWTYDTENRKKYPKGKAAPEIDFPEPDAYWQEAVDYVQENFRENPGQLNAEPIYPYTHSTTRGWLKQFFERRFHEFGDYEDSLVPGESFLHHSVLSPMLNAGLIAPLEIVEESISYAEKNEIPINSLEGFVRQIIGWREFIRGMYECKGVEARTTNFWGFERKIPESFYSGTTGIVPVDECIQKVLKYGYCHHIERLMVLGNFMLLCEFHPREVYRWFMELFVDAYDWVMVPNVYGMSQFADGGLFATKPYISGSNYLLKMGNYEKGDWQRTWDGLFWRFMHVNRDFFLKNPRLSMLVRSFDKMDESKRQYHLKAADVFLRGLDSFE